MLEAKKTLISEEKIANVTFMFLGVINIGFVFMICIYLLIAGLPGIFKIGFTDFILGLRKKVWDQNI